MPKEHNSCNRPPPNKANPHEYIRSRDMADTGTEKAQNGGSCFPICQCDSGCDDVFMLLCQGCQGEEGEALRDDGHLVLYRLCDACHKEEGRRYLAWTKEQSLK